MSFLFFYAIREQQSRRFHRMYCADHKRLAAGAVVRSVHALQGEPYRTSQAQKCPQAFDLPAG